MGNRGQKRPETTDELPADKRACSSLEFRPSSSNSSLQKQMVATNSTLETHIGAMETSSSSSASQSEGEHDRDSTYGSCDSDDPDPRHSDLRDYQRRRSSGDHARLKRILSSLSEECEPSGKLNALTELCDVLNYCTEDSLSSLMSDSFSPLLVELSKYQSYPDVMLLAVRAMTYLCDVFPRASGFLVRYDAASALCQRLRLIEEINMAEQCLQALEKLSRYQPLECLEAGAVMAVLNYIDFFSTSTQRVAVSTVMNICKRLPSEYHSSLMNAVPILCNLLQYEDRQLVENVAICIIKIAERVGQSSEMLDELCRHGVVHQVTHLIKLNSRTSTSQGISNGLLGLLVKLCSGSIIAFRHLHELNISSNLKELLSSHDLPHGTSFSQVIDGRHNQVQEVLKLLQELLPISAGNQDLQQVSDKELTLIDHPEYLKKFGMDMLPLLVQAVNSGANAHVCYGCLSVIYKLVCLSKSEMLVELLKNVNISSFLAGAFTRKDHHVLYLALQITDMILKKLPDVFLNSFIKEGVFFAIDALLTPEKCSQLTFPVFSGFQQPIDLGQKPAESRLARCLCYAFSTGQASLESGNCKLEKDSVYDLAKQIRTNHFTAHLHGGEIGLTDILQQLKTLSSALIGLTEVQSENDPSAHHEEFYPILHNIMSKLSGGESISTFEFIESGIVKSLANYLLPGKHLRENEELQCSYHISIIEKFEMFARLFLSPSPLSKELPLSALIWKLHNALSSLETFPVVLSHAPKRRNSYVSVPTGRLLTHPCLRVRFVMGEGEVCLSDFSNDTFTVDPLSTLDALEEFLWPKVCTLKTEDLNSPSSEVDQAETLQRIFPSIANSGQGNSSDPVETESNQSMGSSLPQIQDEEPNLSQPTPQQAVDSGQANPCRSSPMDETLTVAAKEDIQISPMVDSNLKVQDSASCSSKDTSKLLLYLGGQQLDSRMTLYQAILQQQMKAGEEITSGTRLWFQVHIITYRKMVRPMDVNSQDFHVESENASVSVGRREDTQLTSFISGVYVDELVSDVEKSTPTYAILLLLKSLEGMNRCTFHLASYERIRAFAEGRLDNLDNFRIVFPSVPQIEFVNSKLSEKLDQQMRDSLAASIGGIPSWCNQLMTTCPFLFNFDTKCKYFWLAAFGRQQTQLHPVSSSNSDANDERQASTVSLPRKKILVSRDQIIESAAQMMELHAHHKSLFEVEYHEEVGTGLGPTLEFFTLVSHEFQKSGRGMWREDHFSLSKENIYNESSKKVLASCGLFPRPWSSRMDTSDGIQFAEVRKKFVLLGYIVAKALQEGRVLDIPFSKSFYKVILGQELTVYDIPSFDPELGRTLLEFQALVERKKILEYSCEGNCGSDLDLRFRDTRIEDLCLDFTLPGYPDYIFTTELDKKVVNMTNLDDYVSHVVDATIHNGISRQMEAFISGFNEVFPIKYLQIFTEEELERILCGEQGSWAFTELLDQIKFDHGYTASSPPIINLLEILQEFDHEEKRAFLQFVTGAPRLPSGGLASLNPKLTIVRKHCSSSADVDLPSVMTCANYLKLPPYSSKERMKEKLLYAITEGQGSFHLS